MTPKEPLYLINMFFNNQDCRFDSYLRKIEFLRGYDENKEKESSSLFSKKYERGRSWGGSTYSYEGRLR